MSARDEFRAAIAAAGLTPPDEIIPYRGRPERFSTNGKRSDDSGWYVFHDDARPAGRFGDYRTGLAVTWKAEHAQQWTPEQRREWAERMRQVEAEREAERQRAVATAAEKAARMWEAAGDATERAHDYLTRKQIPGIGARILRDQLLVPLRHGPGALVGLQVIQPDGSRKFLTGTPAGGAYTVIGKPARTGTVVICEGYATGVSIHLATGWCVVVAFSAGNLAAVAAKIRAALPQAEVVIGADDDAFTDGNPGVTAAAATGLPVALPRWAGDRGRGTDFNDLHQAEGLDAVRACFEDPRIIPTTDKAGSVGHRATGAKNPVSPGSASSPARAEAVSEPAAADDPGPANPDEALQGSDVPPDYLDDIPDDLPTGPVHVRTSVRKPNGEPVLIFAGKPMEAAELFHATLPEGGRILFWRGEFFSWDGARYVVRDKVYIEQRLYHWTATCETWKVDPKTGAHEVVAFDPTARKINDIAHALRAVCYADLPEPQCWIEQRPGDPPAHEIIAFRNGFLHWPTRRLMPATDRLFVTSALEFDFDPAAAPPTAWLDFLQNLWPEDPESIAALAEMFGYLLTDDTSQQKMFMLVGPPRSGKGTILRVLESLVGYPNRVSPSLASLGTQFGLQPLIGKRLAMISDARLSGRADQQPIVENLLRISGEDALSIDRKNIAAWTGKLPTRFVLATNELPAFSDASAALANRFLLFRFTVSFLGREDMGLTGRLLGELPSIVLWALDGLERLKARGYLQRPRSADDLAADLLDQTSPIRAFVAECCVVGNDQTTCDRDDLFQAWRKWCDDQGRDHPGTKATFGRQLSAAFPQIRRTQPREGGTRMNLYACVRLKYEWEDSDPIG
jgi:putative DNA primase/helicase